uniref:G_PROTEIN_RECEP_F1_2 domain-containing protein n=1 Tax=Ascaris lumbricoides TaxID=6252 RepID=A0A0M3IB61_ASCLU
MQKFRISEFQVATIGIVVNIFVLIFIRRIDSVKNAFIKFNISQSSCDIIVLVVFAIHAAPMTYFNNAEIYRIEWINRIFGQICGTAYVTCIYTHLLIALNRFMAITFPIKNRNIFTSRNSNRIVFAVWAFCIVQGIVYAFRTIITIACNEELRTAIIHPFSSKHNAVIVISDAISMKHPRTSRISRNN